LATRPATVSKWRAALRGTAWPGWPMPAQRQAKHYDAQDERRILGALDAPPPAGYAR